MARVGLHAPEPQPVTFVELFFDLVFVFAVTQVTVLTATHLTADGIARSALVFWLIWWGWTQFTWTLSPADTQHTVVRACTLAASGAAFVMAASVPRAFASDPLWFAAPYVAIRLIGMALQLRVDRDRPDGSFGVSRTWVGLSTAGLVAVLGGCALDPPARNWIWLLAIGLDLAAASGANSDAVWDLNPRHFSERHGLFVIIALGESLIVAGTAIAQDARTAPLVLAAGGALVVACLLWWTYFGWLKEAMEEGFAEAPASQIGPIARDAYSLTHFPLICGIIGFAVAVEEIVHHPDQPAEAAVVASLAIGVTLFVAASALAYWRLTRVVLGPRLAILAVTVAATVAARSAQPVWPLAAVAAGLLAIAVVEGVRPPSPSPEPQGRPGAAARA